MDQIEAKPKPEMQPEATTIPNVGSQLDRVPSPKTEVQTETVCSPVREIQTRKLEPGSSVDVMVYVAEDVDRIYVQVVDTDTVVLSNVIQEELTAFFPTSPEIKAIPSVGTYVAALFPEDGVVYRARITEIKGEAIGVYYLDFGNSCTVSLADIRALPEKMYEYPALCQPIALARVHRPAGALPKAIQDVLLGCVDNIFNMMVLQSTSGKTECILTKDGSKVLNESIVDLLEQSNETAVVRSPTTMPKLEAATTLAVSPPKEHVPVDNTLGEYFFENGPFLELPNEESFQAVILNVASPQIIMLRVCSDDLSAKLMELEVCSYYLGYLLSNSV